MDALNTADGIIAVVTANMARAIRVISVQRGHDPRDYTLVAFGGAGPLHAARLASELEIRRVLVPRNPGILCAMGLLLADLRADFAMTRLMALSSAIIGEIADITAELRKRCAAWFAERGIEASAKCVALSVDMRYAGQNYELSVPLPACPVTRETIDGLAAGFAAADGVLAVVTANMARAIRVISVQRGHDPRDYTLVAFGGAGPLHAARLAAELDIRHVLVPRNPGILCAMGLLLADLRADFAATRLLALSSAVIGEVETVLAELRRRCGVWFAEAGIAADARRVALSADMRYIGQNYELSVPLPDGPVTPATFDGLAAGFAAAHRQRYGFLAEGEPIQLVTFRAEATGIVRKADLRPAAAAGPDPRSAEIGRREVWLRETGAFVSCPLYDREKLLPGNRIEGPAIVEQMDATTLVVPGARAAVDPYLNLLLELP